MTERRTPLYDFHRRTASQLVKGAADFMFPVSYTSPVEEHVNVRANAGMQDLSTGDDTYLTRFHPLDEIAASLIAMLQKSLSQELALYSSLA